LDGNGLRPEGDAQRAWEMFLLINPVLHAHTPAAMARYKVEPYVVAADVYTVPPHRGRGGWTWYTGSAGWMYRLITETLLGLTMEVDQLRFTPRLPAEWKSFKLHYRYRETNYHILLTRNSAHWQGTPKVVVDDQEQSNPVVSLVDDRRDHKVEVRFGGA
jgi:cellobiose phosphorylase